MNHQFSGFSVWIEPDDQSDYYALLLEKMSYLVKRCNHNVHSDDDVMDDHVMFAPHCTLLYNVSSSDIIQDNEKEMTRLLIRTRDEFRKQLKERARNGVPMVMEDGLRSDRMIDETFRDEEHVICTPTSFYYFPYPKTADNGKGFGCLILMLLIQRSVELSLLHYLAVSIFPQDERHGEQKGEFQPHMALCYASEPNTWLEGEKEMMENDVDSRQLLLPFRGRYISLWNTEGKLSEWKLVTKIEL